MKRTSLASLAMLLAAHCSFADSWLPLSPQAVASPSAARLARIEPAGSANEPAPSKCRALIYAFDESTGEYVRTKELLLANAAAPVAALIRDDGRYLITFDDYFSAGYGDNVIVIYDLETGRDTHLKLEDFLPPAQVAELLESTSSRLWRGAVNLMLDQRFVHIGAATADPFDIAKSFPGFILDLDTRTVSIDHRGEQQQTRKQLPQTPSVRSWWEFWK